MIPTAIRALARRLSREAFRRALSSIFLVAASLGANAAAAQDIQTFERHYENVLGTSMDLSLYGPDIDRLRDAADAAVEEIARLERILSTYRDDSALMRLNRERSATSASTALIEVVQLCEQWRDRSRRDFSCRMGRLIDAWAAAETRQELPVVSDMLPVAGDINDATVNIDPGRGAIELDDPVELEPSGLAKGYIIDHALVFLRGMLPEATAIKLDIGGDASYWGAPAGTGGWEVEVADPGSLADNSGFITTLSLDSMAVATSGHITRSREILGRRFSHILLPRSGWPIAEGVYAVVIAPDTTTADAVATALAVKNPRLGLRWVNSLENVEALLIETDGQQHRSDNWQRYLSDTLQRQLNATIELTLSYTLPEFNSGGYYRPYVAIWISDARQRPIKNLLLLGENERWAQTNSRWWRRVGRRASVPTRNVTRPTRGPGEYELVWDGRDDNGNVLPPGEYLLHLEASRENAGHDYQRIRLTLEEGVQTFEDPGAGELGRAEGRLEVSFPD